MDELLIEDKKYISSKQATKLTGYAKDYIGQLCREGRVPARLVGRSWYVLETAIQDHRFGSSKGVSPAKVAPLKPVFLSAWETPRYEASEAEVLPSVHRPLDLDMETLASVNANQDKESDISERLRDSWREWFDRIADARPAAPTVAREEPIKEEKKSRKQEENEGIRIPVHAVHHPLSAELPPRAIKDYSSSEPIEREIKSRQKEQRVTRGGMKVFHLSGALIALIMAAMAIISTGYFDSYILSNSQVRAIAGLGVYNR